MSETTSLGQIAILLPDLRGGGAERVCIYLANEFVARGLRVDMVLMQATGQLTGLLDPRVRMIDLQASRVRNAFVPLAGYLRKERPAAVLANMWPLPIAALAARLLARRRVRVVGVEHTTWSRSELYANGWTRLQIRWSMRWLYRWLDAVVAVSVGAAADLVRIGAVNRSILRVIYNPISRSMAAFPGLAELPHAWRDATGDRILAVGTLKAIKDFPTLLHAIAKLRQKRDARLVILGDGDERPALEQLTASLGLQGTVTMPGFVSDTRQYYAAANVFVLSSTGEGFGNVIVEALEQGTPVVSTDCPSGPREILEDGKYGTLVPVGDVDALAKAMDEALSREHDRDALKRRAQDFSVEKAADAYLDLLLPGWRDKA